MKRLGILLAGVAVLACGPDGKGTTLVVSVSSDLSVDNEIDAVNVVIADGELSYPFKLGTGAGRTRFPIRVALVPGADQNRQFRVEAVGLFHNAPIVSQAAQVSFVRGTVQGIDLFLGRDCLTTPACGSGFTCERGSCVPEAQGGTRDGGADGPPNTDGGSDRGTATGGTTGTGGAGTGGAGTGGAIGTGGSGTGGTTGTGGAGGRGGAASGGTGTGGSGTGGSAGRGGTGGLLGTGGVLGTGGRIGSGGAMGGGGATAGSVLFFDDFETGNANRWIATPPPDWSVVSDGSLVYRATSVTNNWRTAAAGSVEWTDVSLEARVKVLAFGGQSTSYLAAVCARYVDYNNQYCAVLRSDGNLGLRKTVAGTNTTIAIATVGLTTNTWYTVRLLVVGGSLTVYLNGTSMITAMDVDLPSGGIGLGTYAASAVFDDVRVTRP